MSTHIHVHVGKKRTGDAASEIPARLDKVIRELQGWIRDLERLKSSHEDYGLTAAEIG